MAPSELKSSPSAGESSAVADHMMLRTLNRARCHLMNFHKSIAGLGLRNSRKESQPLRSLAVLTLARSGPSSLIDFHHHTLPDQCHTTNKLMILAQNNQIISEVLDVQLKNETFISWRAERSEVEDST
jgi:hypothetical protein